jgi:Na+-translocating ferredoxin:NAD+ oxidoreductase RnfG subunit
MRLLFVLFSVFSFSWASSQDHNLLTKKEAKFVSGIFQEGSTAEALMLPDQNTALTGSLPNGDRVYLLRQQDLMLGYLLSTRAKGRYEYFDYLLAYAPDFSVLGLTITVYRSSHGAAICQKKWLSQFEAYAGEELTLGKEIDAVAGATISATALVKDMKRCYQLMIRLKEEGLIQ